MPRPERKQRCAKCGKMRPTDNHGYIDGWECADCHPNTASITRPYESEGDRVLDHLFKEARDKGAVYPAIGLASGSPCIVDLENGKVYTIELKEMK